MPAPILGYESSTSDVFIELAFSDGQWKADPLTRTTPSPFEPTITLWIGVDGQEKQLARGRIAGGARVSRSDRRLGAFALSFGRSLVAAVNGDYEDPLYVLYFGTERPYEFRKPLSSGRLETMRSWIPRLQTSAVPALAAFAPTLVDMIADADAAIQARTAAEEQIKTFESSDKKDFYDQANSVRKLAYGQIGQLRFQHPELRLPADYAEGFFMHRVTPPLGSSASYNARIKNAQARVVALQAKQAEAKAREDAAAAKKTKAETKKTKVADAKQGVKAAEDHLKEVEDEPLTP